MIISFTTMNKIIFFLLTISILWLINETNGTIFKNRNRVIVKQDADSRGLSVEHEENTYSAVGQFIIRLMLAIVDIGKSSVRNLFFGRNRTDVVLQRSARSVRDHKQTYEKEIFHREFQENIGKPSKRVEIYAEPPLVINTEPNRNYVYAETLDSDEDREISENDLPYILALLVYRPESNIRGSNLDGDPFNDTPSSDSFRRNMDTSTDYELIGSLESSFSSDQTFSGQNTSSSSETSSSSFEESSSSFNENANPFNQTSTVSFDQTVSNDSSSTVQDPIESHHERPFSIYGPPSLNSSVSY